MIFTPSPAFARSWGDMDPHLLQRGSHLSWEMLQLAKNFIIPSLLWLFGPVFVRPPDAHASRKRAFRPPFYLRPFAVPTPRHPTVSVVGNNSYASTISDSKPVLKAT